MTKKRAGVSTSSIKSRDPNLVGKKFHLPWLAAWRRDFLECSRILSRERQADEIAQRLLYRLQLGLKDRNRSLDDVKVLACVTTPAMLLAAALHRWWPGESRPAIADLGYYLMLGNPKELPVIVRTGGVVVVQDVLDTHRVSGELVEALNEQRAEVLCVLGFVHLLSNVTETRATPVNYWWTPDAINCPHHALIETRRPDECEPPRNANEDAQAFWVEPRSLHPLRYTTLRRELTPGRDPLLDRRDIYLKQFDNSNEGCLLTAGHYVYGRRHYSVTIDIRRALTSEIGEHIARWLADICEGRQGRNAPWETERGKTLQGDVTGVLMPLHSQIHYVWPKVVNLLAQRDRRQLNWWLESTLFTGSGQDYFLPAQFESQIKSAVKDAIESPKPPEETIDKPLRILILDDAIATAKTAESVITTILRKVRKAFTQSGKSMESCPSPIAWIRYFSFLNQMDNARHLLWHSIPVIGRKRIPIVFEEFAPFMGVPIYDEGNCPACRDLMRLIKLSEKCEQLNAEEPRRWTKQRLKELRPIAVDNPDFRGHEPKSLKKPINVLAARAKLSKSPEKFQFMYADTAIWRFYELMSLSYPPNDVLHSLDEVSRVEGVTLEETTEYERYRWAVLEWCLHHWSRIKANAAEDVFIKYAKKEVQNNSALLERIVEAASVHYRDLHITNFIADLIRKLAELEQQRIINLDVTSIRKERTLRLEKALTAFFFNIPADNIKKLHFGNPDENGSYPDLLTFLGESAQEVSPFGHNVVRNLYLSLTRPQRYAEPTWTLETIAESLCRGRDPEKPQAGSHELLPKLIADVRGSYIDDLEKRRFLRTSLVQFLGALEDIKHYYGWKFSKGVTRIEEFSEPVLDWLKLSPTDEGFKKLPDALRHLEDAILPRSEFSKEFDEVYHDEVAHIGIMLEAEAKEKDKGGKRLDFEFLAEEEVKRCKALTNINGLVNCLTNLTINPIDDPERNSEVTKYRSRIEVRLLKEGKGAHRLTFRLLTNFAGFMDTQNAINRGPSISTERSMLEAFGAKFGEVKPPASNEEAEGFTACYELSVMTGFVPRSLR